MNSATHALTRKLPRFLTYVRHLFAGAAFACFAYFAVFHAQDILAALGSASMGGAFIALLLLVLSHLLMPIHVVLALRNAKWCPTYSQALALYARRIPARYVPGGIWHLAARVLDLHTMGVPKEYLVAIAILQSAGINGLAFLLGGIGISLQTSNHYTVLGGIVGAVAGLAMILASIWFVSRRLVSFSPRLSSSTQLSMASVLLGVVICFGFSFGFFLRALPEIQTGASLMLIVSVVLFARAIGFLALFAPKGIGVFEAVAAGLLVEKGQFASAAFFMFGFRALGFAADTMVWACSLLLDNPTKKAVRPL